MMSFNNLSIRIKIITIILVISLTSLLLAGLIFYAYDKSQYELSALRVLNIQAEIIGDNNTANLVYNSPAAAVAVLNTLAADKNIKVARIYDKNKLVFAEYAIEPKFKGTNLDFIARQDTFAFVQKSLLINKRIVLDNEVIGHIYLHSGLDDYNQRIANFLKVFILILIIASVIALLLSMRLQHLISAPIIRLTNTMRGIGESKNYAIRIKNTATDEIGQLITGFNNMIEQISKQSEDLKHAKELAEASAKIKEQFLANMSHEIRTPMNGIIGMARLLTDTPLNKDQKKYLDNIVTSSDNLLVIINDILDFSKIEAGKLDFESIEFDLFELIHKIDSSFMAIAQTKNLYFKTNIGDKVPQFVIGDPTRINQILTNLLSNAVKFTSRGGISLFVKVVSASKSKANLNFEVTDTGIGIPANKINDVFSSFSQASNSTSRKYGGTGLGLTISKQLAELMGGHILVESIENTGSVFTLSLSLNIGKGVTAVHKEPNDTIAEFLPIKANANILLAEDNDINQLFVSTLLKPKYNITVANNGFIACKLLEQSHYDLILMDLHMPDMDGYEATRTIRKMPDKEKGRIPIIALTAAAIKGEREKCLAAGMNDYISKPFDPSDLFAVIEKHLKTTHRPIIETKPVVPPKKQANHQFKWVDLTYIHSIGQGDGKFQNDLLRIFKEQLPIFINDLVVQLNNSDYQTLAATAHKAKSSVALLGVTKLQHSMEQLELKAKAQIDTHTFKPIIDEFIDIANQVLDEIKDLKF
jgi:two-component system, sensor histidine kinase